MTLTRLLAAAAVSALLAGPAFAAQDPEPNVPAEPSDSMPMASPSADMSASPASARMVDPSAPAVILGDSPTPSAEAWRLKAGDPAVVSNAPVPDTAENRARYGAPISNGGRNTRPAGN